MKTKKHLGPVPAVVLALAAYLILANGPDADSATQQKRALRPAAGLATVYNVKAFGAKGDGKTLDTPAINKAIGAAALAGGGTVHFPAGIYLSFSIQLKSNIALYLDQGATILAADPKVVKGSYDSPEPNDWDMYQDFGHSHWQNSLIWGNTLQDVADFSAYHCRDVPDTRLEHTDQKKL